MRNLLLIALFFILIGCTIDEKDYFNGSIKEVVDSTKIDSTKIKKINLVDINLNSDYISQQILIHDSLVISYLFSDNNYFFNIVNIKDGNLIGQFCHKGKGNNELLYCIGLNNCYVESNELKTLVTDTHKDMLYEWNISKSIETKETIFDKIIDFKIIEPDRPYTYTYRINDSTLLGYLSSGANDFYRTKPILPAIELRDIFSKNIFKTINVFKDTFEEREPPVNRVNNEKGFIPSFNFFRSITDVRPDCKYAVQAMVYLAQINIINIMTGEVKGIRLKDSPDFSIFRNYKRIEKRYFSKDVIATNDYIYVGYSGENLDVKGNNVGYIYKFDWNGDIIDVYDLSFNVSQILYDRATNKLYAFDSSNLKLYLVDIEL